MNILPTGCIFSRLLIAGAILAATLATAPPATAAEQRVALVIGNSAYPSAPLRNSVNDANAMAAKLRTLGFDVILRTDITQRDMSRAIGEFGKKLTLGSVGLFYFAGHGLQVRGKNFLVPVDAEIDSEASVRGETVDVDQVLDQLGPAKLSMVILDACRNNPFEARFRRIGGGLAQIDAPTGTLLAYATAPGRVAADGNGSNGTYTAALLKALDVPGLKVEDIFRQVRNEVLAESGNQQIPWEASSLTVEFYFRPGAKAQTENVMLQQSERQRAELLKEMEKLRGELVKLRDGPAATGATTTAQTHTSAASALPEQVVLAVPMPAAPVQSKTASNTTDWKSRVALLERSLGQLSLTRALAVLLDMTTDDELGLLLVHENEVKRKNWHNSYAMGVNDQGNLVWGGGFQLRTAALAIETAVEQCASGARNTCKAVIANGDFREREFLEMAKQLGAQDVTATREAFVRSLAQRPAETRIGLSGVAGGGTGDFHYAFGYSSVRK